MFERFDDAFLAEHLLPARDFMLYPPYEDRAAWAALEEPVKEEMVRRGEVWLEYPWPSLLATRYMDFMRTGNRSRRPHSAMHPRPEVYGFYAYRQPQPL